MSNEDKMRKVCDLYLRSEDCKNAVLSSNISSVFVAGWNACAAIKDAEIAEANELWKDLRNVLECTQKEVIARDLMIKELREVLISVSEYTRHPDYDWDSGLIKDVEQALAHSEHHNSRALEKMLLEARIDELNSYTSGKFFVADRAKELEAKLAELNKE